MCFEQASQILNFLKINNLKELKENLKNPLSQEGIKELENVFEVGKNAYFVYSTLILTKNFKFHFCKILKIDFELNAYDCHKPTIIALH